MKPEYGLILFFVITYSFLNLISFTGECDKYLFIHHIQDDWKPVVAVIIEIFGLAFVGTFYMLTNKIKIEFQTAELEEVLTH